MCVFEQPFSYNWYQSKVFFVFKLYLTKFEKVSIFYLLTRNVACYDCMITMSNQIKFSFVQFVILLCGCCFESVECLQLVVNTVLDLLEVFHIIYVGIFIKENKDFILFGFLLKD